MVVEVKEITAENLASLQEVASACRHRGTLAAHYGKLKRGLDGLEYQKAMRDEWR